MLDSWSVRNKKKKKSWMSENLNIKIFSVKLLGAKEGAVSVWWIKVYSHVAQETGSTLVQTMEL